MDVTLKVRGLSKSYGSKVALSSVDLDLVGGRAYALLGLNGSGKSTCLHAVTGLISPDSGQVDVGGVPISQPQSRLEFGFAPDDLPLIGALTGTEYLEMHDRFRGRDDSELALDLALAFEMQDSLGQQIEGYSHGMKRKIQLISAMMHAPRLLILDEPFRGLDPDAVIVLREVIRVFIETGKSVLIATHDMTLADRYCDEVFILDHGVIVAHDTPSNLVAAQGRGLDLETAFMAITGRESESRERQLLVSDSFGQQNP